MPRKDWLFADLWPGNPRRRPPRRTQGASFRFIHRQHENARRRGTSPATFNPLNRGNPMSTSTSAFKYAQAQRALLDHPRLFNREFIDSLGDLKTLLDHCVTTMALMFRGAAPDFVAASS